MTDNVPPERPTPSAAAEQRHRVRIALDLAAWVSTPRPAHASASSSGYVSLLARTLDLSNSGIGVLSPVAIAPGELVLVEVQSPDGLLRPCRGQVVWCAPHAERAGQLRIGIALEAVAPDWVQ